MYAAYIVKRTQIYLDAAQAEGLRRRANASGTTSSRLIREAVETYLTVTEDAETQLARQRHAIDEAFGAITRLPGGAAFVDAARAPDTLRTDELDERWRSP